MHLTLAIDYKLLLIKYIDHVGCCEGVTFIPKIEDENHDFTKDEIKVLLELAED